MASELLLPLFPLEVVLLPQERLPLHIFEERYKLMIGEAMEQHSEFGVVMAKENSLANMGCSATIEQVTRQYPDGRLDILTRGQRRFEILFLNEEKPYLQGAVHYFDDDAATSPSSEDVRRMGDLYRQTAALLPSSAERPALEEQATSFQVAGALPLDVEFKQRLLRARSEADRVLLLTEVLEKLVPRLRLAKRTENVAKGNGQGR